MTDTRRVIETYGDLAADTHLRGIEVDAVARAVQDLKADEIVVVPEPWLLKEKALEGMGRHDRVLVGELEAETPKAVRLKQGETADWLPKSCSEIYVRADDAAVTIPQHGLGDFDGGDEADV
jgi:hypothetical protein